MLVVLNHKMNLTYQEIKSYKEQLSQIEHPSIDLVVCPSMPYLSAFTDPNYKVGSQNVSAYKMGSHTGETASKQLKSLNVSHCLVGHSERRNSETKEERVQKLKQLLEEDITPILCIGETKVDRENGKTKNVLKWQIEEALQNFSTEEVEKIIFAYEPVWAIGTGVTPTIEEITESITFIQEIVNKHCGKNPKVLYGGSINENNFKSFLTISNCAGFLIGGYSLNLNQLKKLLEYQK